MNKGAHNSANYSSGPSGPVSHSAGGLGFVLALGVALLAAGVGGYFANQKFGAPPPQLTAASILPSGSQVPATNGTGQAPVNNSVTPSQPTTPQSSAPSQTQTSQSTGQADFQAYCLKCHRSVSRLQRYPASDIIGATAYGKGKMPGFSQQLTQDRMQAIADYIASY